MLERTKSMLFCVFIVFATAFFPAPATFAASGPCSDKTGQSFLSFPKWNRGLLCENVGTATESVSTDNAIPTLIWTVVLNGLDILLRVAGILAVVMLIFNGYQYLTAQGESSKISAAKTGLLQAIVGLAIALLSSTIIYFVVGRLTTP